MTKSKLPRLIVAVDALISAMRTSVANADPKDVWKHSSYKAFAVKYNRILKEAGPFIDKETQILDVFMVDTMRSSGDTFAMQQKEIFDAVLVNATILRGILLNTSGAKRTEAANYRDFFKANLRRAVLKKPEKESDIQDVMEQLLIGRGLDKGSGYDRETGRVRFSAKEVVPDFVLLRLDLAVEAKLVKSKEKSKAVIDEINADIRAYGKKYGCILFVVYDLGFIRDENEFKSDLEVPGAVDLIIVKH